jgi:membrane fusion protein, adhesin transport system
MDKRAAADLERRWRHEGKVARPDDLEHMSDTSAAILLETPRGARVVIWIAVLFLGSALAWASWAELDEVTRGAGKVIPTRQVQVVQNLEGGILADILATEGEVVERGQVLLRIDDTRFSASFREGRLHYLALQAKAARLTAEANGTGFQAPPELEDEQTDVLERELKLFQSRQLEIETNLLILRQQSAQRRQEVAELKSRRSHLVTSHRLVLQELQMTRPLVKDGAISEVEVLRLERQENELRGELESTDLAIQRAQSRLEEAESKLEEVELHFRNRARVELNEVMAELRKMSESQVALEDRVLRTLVRSPVRGTVKQVLVRTVGGVIQPGMDLVEIVPLEDSLLVEARIRPADIAFLRPGQKAIVKFSAYDFAIYGGLDAEVVHISADTIMDDRDEANYLVRVRTDRSYLGPESEPLPIIVGMLAEVDILTGKKTVLEYLLKPVLRATDRALRER